MDAERVAIISLGLGIIANTKDLAEWAYRKMMAWAKDCWKLSGFRWTKGRKACFEILTLLAVGSFALTVLAGMGGEKRVAVWFAWIFLLVVEVFVTSGFMVPSVLDTLRMPRRKRTT